MSKFVLDCEAVSQICEDLSKIESNMTEMSSTIGGYDTSDCEDFNFPGAVACISNNVRAAAQKIGNTVNLVNTVMTVHTEIQNGTVFDPNAVVSTSSDISTVSNEATTGTVEHVVTSKDTLSGLAATYGTTVGAIMAANSQIKDKNLIYDGDTLIIPTNNKQTSVEKTTNEKEVSATEQTVTTSNESVSGKHVAAQFTAYYPADNAMEGGFYDCRGNLLDPSAKTCAAPKEIPYGTRIQIQGTGTELDGQIYTVNDVGGAININDDGSYHFDILMSTNAECNEWGVRGGSAIILDD